MKCNPSFKSQHVAVGRAVRDGSRQTRLRASWTVGRPWAVPEPPEGDPGGPRVA
jgi:hypothetical protein